MSKTKIRSPHTESAQTQDINGNIELSVHHDLVTGKRQAWAWGAVGDLPAFLARSPYRYQGIVDVQCEVDSNREVFGIPVRHPSVLATVNPAAVAIVNLVGKAAREEIERDASQLGSFRVVEPYLPARDEPLLVADANVTQAQKQWDQRLTDSLSKIPPYAMTPENRRIALWLWRLCSGGAERQMFLLAVGLREQGWDVLLITTLPDSESCAHWSAELDRRGVKRCVLKAPRESWVDFSDPTNRSSTLLEIVAPHLESMPAIQVCQTAALLTEFRPGRLVTYLESGNVIAGLAAILAGVPRISISARNANPTNFPEMPGLPAEPRRLAGIYKAMLATRRVRLTSNNKNSARSYESWLGLKDGLVVVVPNAVIPPNPADAAEHLLAKASPTPTRRMVLGIMRLDNEKDPLTWINTFAEITKVDPNLEARIIGEGPLRRLVLERIGELGLESRIILEGKTTSPLEVIQRAVLLLLTSSEEGMPNVVLEAQACGKVIVATDVGGVREALAPPLHQFLCRPKDPQALAKACLRVLTEPDEAHRLGQQAKAYVEIQFGLTRLVDRTLQVLDH